MREGASSGQSRFAFGLPRFLRLRRIVLNEHQCLGISAIFRHSAQATLRQIPLLAQTTVVWSIARVHVTRQTAAGRVAGRLTKARGVARVESNGLKSPGEEEKMQTMPKTLPKGRGILSKAGQAPEPGGTRYFDLAAGTQTTVFETLVIRTGPQFSVLAVKGNQVLNRVRLDHGALFGGERIAIGDTILAGALRMTETGAIATMGWPFRAGDSRNGQHGGTTRPPWLAPARPARCVGTCVRVHSSGRFSQLLEDRTARLVFAHASAYGPRARMVVGSRVNYTAASTPRGPAALDIRPHQD